MDSRFDELLRRFGVIDDLVRAGTLLGWDEETKMPPAGADARAEQRATVEAVTHEHRVDPALGELLEELRPFEEAHDPDSFEASIVRVARRDYEKAVRVPPALQAELERAGSLGYRAWLRARAENDFGIMLPHFERNLELRREYVACFAPTGDPYDVVLDDYERGMKTAEVEVIFDRLKERLVPMIRAVSDSSRSTTRACAARSRGRRSTASRWESSKRGGWRTRPGASTTPCTRSRCRWRSPTSA